MFKKYFVTALFLFASFAAIASQVTTLLWQATATTTGAAYVFAPTTPYRAHVAALNASGTSATVEIDGSNDGQNWIVLGTIGLTSGAPVSGIVTQAPYASERAKVTAIAGTGAAVTVTVGN